MKKRKILLVILSVTLLATLLVGCGSGTKDSKPASTTSSGAMDKTPLTFTFFSMDT